MPNGTYLISDLIDLVMLTAIAASVYTDLRWGKIYNKITLPTLALGFVLNIMGRGLAGAVFSLGGLGAGLAFGILLFAFRVMGGGDLKLAAGIGALKGCYFLAWMGLYTFLVGGIVSAIVLARRGALARTLGGLGRVLVYQAPVSSVVDTKYERMPYSPMIAAGVILALVHLSLNM